MKIAKQGFPGLSLALLAVCLLIATGTAHAAPGDMDPGFNGGIPALIDDTSSMELDPVAAAIDPVNGDIFWAGQYYDGSNTGASIAAYKPDGTLDDSVGSGGQINLSADQAGAPGGRLQFLAIAVDAQGRILASGWVVNSTGIASVLLARFLPDGTLDTGFGAAGTGIVVTDRYAVGSGLSLMADGHILVTGSAPVSSNESPAVWRFNADGTVDTSFGTNGRVQVAGIDLGTSTGIFCFPALEPDNTLIVACVQAHAGPWAITRLKPDGSVDADFGTSGFISGSANQMLAGLVLTPDGGFVISEIDTSVSPRTADVRRYLPDGTISPSFNSGNPVDLGIFTGSALMPVIPLAVQPDGKIIGARSGSGATGNTVEFGRLNVDGSLDMSFGSSGTTNVSFTGGSGSGYTPEPTALLLQGDGKIVASGIASSLANGKDAAFVTRILNDTPFNLTPDVPAFDPVSGTPLGQALASNAATVSGVAIGAETRGISLALTVRNGQYSTTGTGGPFMGTASGANAALIHVGDMLALQQITSTTGDSDTITHVAIGGFWASNNYEASLGSPVTATWTTTTDTPPTANDGTLDVTAGQTATGALDAGDPSDGTLTFSILTQPGHGTLSLDDANTGAFTYTADSGYSGNDSFTWKANDGVADSNMATITITVSASSSGGGSNGGGGASSSGGGGSLGLLALCLLALMPLGITLIARFQRGKR